MEIDLFAATTLKSRLRTISPSSRLLRTPDICCSRSLSSATSREEASAISLKSVASDAMTSSPEVSARLASSPPAMARAV